MGLLYVIFIPYFVLLPISLAGKASECQDYKGCPEAFDQRKPEIPVVRKCRMYTAIVAPDLFPLFGPKHILSTINDVCPKTCGTCQSAITTPPPALTTTKTPEEEYEHILQTDDVFKKLMEKLLKHGIAVNNSADGLTRYTKYVEEKAKVDEHNQLFERGESTYWMGVNKFTVMTEDERPPLSLSIPGAPTSLDSAATNDSSTLTILRQITSLIDSGSERRYRRDAEEIVNWTSHLNPVADQGTCGGCWAFAMRGMIEGVLSLMGTPTVPLSVQQLLDCDNTVDDSYKLANTGCGGGYFQIAAQYLMKKSLATDDVYPFKGVTSKCRMPSLGVSPRVHSFESGYVTALSPSSLSLLSSAMEERVRKGPVSVGMAVVSEVYAYAGGVYEGPCGNAINHAVVLVGFTESYWVVRNSWGSSWGENGYIRVKRTPGADPCMLTSYWAAVEEMGTVEVVKAPPPRVDIEEVASTTPAPSNDTVCPDCCPDDCCECEDDDEDDDDDYYDYESGEDYRDKRRNEESGEKATVAPTEAATEPKEEPVKATGNKRDSDEDSDEDDRSYKGKKKHNRKLPTTTKIVPTTKGKPTTTTKPPKRQKNNIVQTILRVFD